MTTTITDEQAVQAMSQYGGNFVKQLARLWQLADFTNRARIASAFGDEFGRYRELAGQSVEA
ncbi:hypothetical protein [Bordetella genomosp. 12]|uniref:Uncharacterized protein n=1 Tax=Bordetella genomosp. 12 TaxID=463035 RepID=A0A261VK96_9BORD|nr:hypothetical protein [Bordetella genomosp. 12]OZI74558.1 hypothetical protein CAL22_08850 [Bordetella genomosp. 12]